MTVAQTRGNAESSADPVLSIVLCSRNDQYMGDSQWRLRSTLAFLARSVEAIGRTRDVEIIVTDWGSVRPLSRGLSLSPAAAELTRFLYVPPELAAEIQGESPFSEVHALNAAVRRARGDWVGRIDQDTLVGEQFFAVFFDLHARGEVEGRPLDSAMLFSNRRSIPYGFAARCPPFAEVARFIDVFGRALRVENHLSAQNYWSSFVGIWLLPRRTWHECSGYDERMVHMNWMETDMVLRLRNRYELVDLGRLTGYDFYHLEHYHHTGSLIRRRENDRTANTPIDLDGVRPLRYPGDVRWGLGHHELTLEASVASWARTDAVVRGRWLGPGLASVAGELTTHHLSTLAMFVDRQVGRVGKVLAERSPRLYHGLKKRLRL